MRYVWETNKQPKLLEADIFSTEKEKVLISVYDWKKPNTVYSQQVTEIQGNNKFEISLPLTPEKVFFEIRVLSGSFPLFNDNKIVVKLKDSKLQPGKYCELKKDKNLSEFIQLISWFSENAGVLSAAYANSPYSEYKSVGGKFTIRYFPVIMEEKMVLDASGKLIPNPYYGQESPTSFRVHSKTRVIEVSQKYAKQYTVAQRMALLAHEYSHAYLNRDPDSEEEADENAIRICRCFGFSKREIGTAFGMVFQRYPSAQNANRIILIKKLLQKLP